MKVIICEDDSIHRQFIYDEIKCYAMFHEPSIEIVLCTGNPDDVLAYLEHHKADCYFLDIDLQHKLSGMDIANHIRQHDPIANIIFITTYANQLKLTFKYNLAALDYIVKTDMLSLKEALLHAIQVAFQKYQQLSHVENLNYFQVKVGQRIKQIPFNDIYFFTTSIQAHKIELYTKSSHHQFYGKLKDIESMLNEHFFRCHNSFIINLHHIKETNSLERTITMVNGMMCNVSFRAFYKLQKLLKNQQGAAPNNNG